MTRSNPDGPAVIVDPYSSGGFYASAFARVGVPVVAVTSRPTVPEVYRPSYNLEDFAEVIPYAGELEPVARKLGRLAPRCILPGHETGVELADLLAAEVAADVANDPALIRARHHKGEMAAAVARAGLPMIRQLCTAEADQVAAWIEREGLGGRDLVVKPPRSSATDGVTRVRGGDDWRAVFDTQLGSPNQWDIVNDQMVVQEYVTGTEYVVDTFSYSGVHTVTDVCRYRKIHNGPHMAVYDSMEWLPPDDSAVRVLVEYTAAVLDAVGMRYGSAHVELMLTGDGPRLIELGARAHGGGQPRFCRVATGDSQIDRAVRYFARVGEIPARYVLHQHVMVVFLVGRVAGVVRNAEVLDTVSTLPSHYFSSIGLRSGDRIGVTRDLLGTLALGFVVLAHPDRDQLLADYEDIRRIEMRLVVTSDESVAETGVGEGRSRALPGAPP